MEYYHSQEKKPPNTPARNLGIYNPPKPQKGKRPDSTDQ